MPRRFIHLVRSHIAFKLTLTLVGFVGVTLIVAGLYLNRALEGLAAESLESRLTTAARLLHRDARSLAGRGARVPDVREFVLRAARESGARVTLIAPDGGVTGDSEVAAEDLPRLDNHAGRPEVRAALAGRVGSDLRTSATLRTPLLYVAIPIEEGGRVAGVLRLALPLAAVSTSHAALQRELAVGGLVALAVAVGIGIFVAGRVTRPVVEMQAIARRMSEGDVGTRAPVRSLDEIGALGRALNVMMTRLRDRIEDLQQERAKTTAILDGLVEGVIAVDGHETILLMNERARAMFDVRPGPIERRAFLEVIRSADLHEIFRESRAATAGALLRRELRLAHPAARTVAVNAVPLRLAGDETGVVMVVHDVTELRWLEQVRTEFIANVSHELRTPLTAIRGYVETLLEGALEDAEHARKFLEVASRHAERMGRLLDDLMDLSNIELGKVTLRREPLRLDELVESVLAIVRPRAERGSVTLRSHLDPPSTTVYADHDRLAQILINLLDNAVKYTPAGGSVTVGAREAGPGEGRGAPEDRIEIVVADTGIGIPRADLPRITERFYRVDKARSRELGGTGLGLAIVKHLVLAHGGELRIESEEGRGTTVRVALPARGAGD